MENLNEQLFKEWMVSDINENEVTLQDAFNAGYSCGVKWETEHWHDIRKAPADLPTKVTKKSSRLCLVATKIRHNGKITNHLARYNFMQNSWKDDEDCFLYDVIAWMYFPIFLK